MGTPQPHEATSQHDHSQGSGQRDGGENAATKEPPAPPKPENDIGIVPPVKSPSEEEDDLSPEHIKIFTLKPVSALKLLCRSIDALVQMTGDVPPTPPIRTPRSRSPVRPNFGIERKLATQTAKRDLMNLNMQIAGQEQSFAHESIDGVPFKRTPIGSPEANPWEMNSPPQDDVGANAPPVHIQHLTLARKFYSKRPPPISTEEYLMRMHKYCPMSTAVYLATSVYITRLAITERLIPVTPRNVHRLLLAGLRVAMKALEDMSWPHGRFAKVGGVSEAELGRLEITFCFLTSFVLKVDADQLQREAESLARTYKTGDNDFAVLDWQDDPRIKGIELKLPENRFKHGAGSGTRTPEKRKASSTLPSRPALHVGASVNSSIEVIGQS